MEYHGASPLRSVATIPEMAAHRYGDKTAFVVAGEATGYATLASRVRDVASMLHEAGVDPGDRVGLYLPNTLQFPESYFGTIAAGAVPVPLNLRMDDETLTYVLQDAGIDDLIASELFIHTFETDHAAITAVGELADQADVHTTYVPGGHEGAVDYDAGLEEPPAELPDPGRAYDDVAAQLYTSGTTGDPKGVPLTHENLLSALESITKSTPASDPDDTLLLVLPLFHIYGLNALMTLYCYRGGTIVLQPRPDAETMLSAIDEYDVNHFPTVPAILREMERHYREDPDAYDLSSLEAINSAAAPLSEDTRRRIVDGWDVVMGEGWGMTETAPAGTIRTAASAHKGAGCIGRPMYNLELRLVDPETREVRVTEDELDLRAGPLYDAADPPPEEAITGEIAVRGPQVFEGYYELPDQTAAAFDDEGWFYTNDIARVDADGALWIVDRADDMIIAGGENVYPAEIEEPLYDHPAVAEAAVVGIDHAVKGEAPVAFVVLEDDAEIDEEALRSFTLEHVPSYAHPRRIFFVEKLPRSATNKVQRYELRERATEAVDGELSSSERL